MFTDNWDLHTIVRTVYMSMPAWKKVHIIFVVDDYRQPERTKIAQLLGNTN